MRIDHPSHPRIQTERPLLGRPTPSRGETEMEFAEDVKVRSERFARRVADHNIETEEATKNSFVLPFIQMLGYNPFEPDEVVPEFTADIGTKKGEKVDYALMHDGSPSILVECKKVGSTFGEAELTQLMRYFTVTDARFGILTDGLIYRFYSDLEEQNLMDARPFFTFNMLDFMDQDVKTLKTFTKDEFKIDKALPAARRTKFLTSIKQVLREELSEPTERFLEFMRGSVYEGRQTSRIRSELDPLIRDVCKRFIDEEVQVRINAVLTDRKEIDSDPSDESTTESEPPDDSDEEFTQQELDAFQKVRSRLGGVINPERLVLTKAKFAKNHGVGITVDGSRKRLVCRIRWDESRNLYKILLSWGEAWQDVGATIDGFDAFVQALRENAMKWA